MIRDVHLWGIKTSNNNNKSMAALILLYTGGLDLARYEGRGVEEEDGEESNIYETTWYLYRNFCLQILMGYCQGSSIRKQRCRGAIGRGEIKS